MANKHQLLISGDYTYVLIVFSYRCWAYSSRNISLPAAYCLDNTQE